MSKELKDQLIRLGSRQPQLRKHIRPVLRQIDAAGSSYSTTVELIDRRTRDSKLVKTVVHPDGYVSHKGPVADVNGTLWPVKGLGSPSIHPKVELPSSVFRKVRTSSMRTALDERFKKLDRAIHQWALKAERRLQRSYEEDDVHIGVDTQGITESRSHPHWSVEMTVGGPGVIDPSMTRVVVQGDVTDPSYLEMYKESGYGSSGLRPGTSKELYDWTERDVLGLLDRWL